MSWDVIAPRTEDMAVHAVLIPGGSRGKILYFGGYRVDNTHLFDVAPPYNNNSIENISANLSPEYNTFCAGHAFLADGRVLVAAGQLQLYDENDNEIAPPPSKNPGMIEHAVHGGMSWGGERRSSIFSPIAGIWEEISPMNLDPAGNPQSGGRWYPTLVTLANGEVLAVGGHPDLREEYPSAPNVRHSNNVPERYTPGSDTWTLLGDDPPTTDQKTANDGAWNYDYQRTHLLPDGRVFFSSPVRGKNRYYDPWAGVFVGNAINLSSDGQYDSISATWTSVMLPLLHQENFRPRILLMGGQTAQRIDLGANPPSWSQAGARDEWDGTPPVRNFVCPVILPTGEIFFTGGCEQNSDPDPDNPPNTDQIRQDSGVLPAEIYDPTINWNNGSYSGQGDWRVVEATSVVRHYHSVALLMPDGKVWTAGSNGPSDEGGGRELRIDIYSPPYADVANRPTITSSPSNIGYLYQFLVDTPQANTIERVALIRCGSCTHGFNPDQRYIGLSFDRIDSNTLRVQSPPNGNIAPPGYYMLWIVDNQDRPCEVAPFIRVSKQKCYFTADVSTYSIHEVNALGTPANFLDALYLVFDGFLPDEIGSPAVELEDLNGESVPGMSVTLGAPQYESNPQIKDIAQRVAFPIDVRFDNTQAFDAIPNGEDFALIRVLGRMGDFNCNENLTLSLNPNPRMSDGNPHWLSIDLRVFKTIPGEASSAGVTHGSGADSPYDYIQGLLAAYNGWQGGNPHPFDQLPTDQETNRLTLDDTDANGNPVYNYAVARVRFRAPEGVNAADVRLFFRQWTTGWTSLNYGNPKASNGSYRRHGDGSGAAPLLGLTGGEVNNIPCFAEPRVANMEDQTDETNRRTLEGADAAEVHGYFGCWLDTNQDNELFPLEPEGDGPFNGELLTVRQHMRGLHQCLVAEIHYTLDPIASGDTPASSDNLSQRNILFDETDNPGSFSAHLVHHTFEIKASPHAFPPPQLSVAGSTATGARLHPDELAIHWGDLPRDSQASLYMPQVEVDDVLRFAASRGGPRRIEKTGPGGVRLKVGDVTYVPLPGPMPKNIASLLSIQLAPGLPKGKKYRVVVRQVDGRRRRIVGTTEFLITVSSAGQMRFQLERNLAVLRHIQLSIPPSNRWYPVFERYVGELEERVRAVGGDPDAVEPLPGDARPGKPDKPDRPGKRPRPGHHRGKVKELLYDCFGDFEGFVLEDCDDRQRFSACEAGIERVVRQACRDRSTITVVTDGEDRRKVMRIVVHCC